MLNMTFETWMVIFNTLTRMSAQVKELQVYPRF